MAKAKPVTIGRDEWLRALGDVVQPDPDALTIEEIGALIQRSRASTTRLVKRLEAQHRVQRVVKMVPRSGGGSYPAPAYKLLP